MKWQAAARLASFFPLALTLVRRFQKNPSEPHPTLATNAPNVMPDQLRSLVTVAEMGTLLVLGLPIGNSWLRAIPSTFYLTGAGVFATALLEGREVTCNCVGAEQNSVIKWHSVGRNVALAALSIAAFTDNRKGGKMLTALDLARTTLFASHIGMTITRSIQYRNEQQDKDIPLIAKDQILPDGTFSLMSDQSTPGTIQVHQYVSSRSQPTHVLLSTPDCDSCVALVKNLCLRPEDSNLLVLFRKGTKLQTLEQFNKHNAFDMGVDVTGAIEHGWGVRGFPTLLAIDTEARLSSHPIVGITAVSSALGVELDDLPPRG